jgi:hypothetical protein
MESGMDPVERRLLMESLARARITVRAREFCLKWVEDFLWFCAQRGLDKADRGGLAIFLGDMERRGREPYQVVQARCSIHLFWREALRHASGLGRATDARLPASSDNGLSPEWRSTLGRLDEEIRLRHFSPKTLKAYRH